MIIQQQGRKHSKNKIENKLKYFLLNNTKKTAKAESFQLRKFFRTCFGNKSGRNLGMRGLNLKSNFVSSCKIPNSEGLAAKSQAF